MKKKLLMALLALSFAHVMAMDPADQSYIQILQQVQDGTFPVDMEQVRPDYRNEARGAVENLYQAWLSPKEEEDAMLDNMQQIIFSVRREHWQNVLDEAMRLYAEDDPEFVAHIILLKYGQVRHSHMLRRARR